MFHDIRITRADAEAQALLNMGRGRDTNPNNPYNSATWCGDQIIQLAERIKAERLTVAMNK